MLALLLTLALAETCPADHPEWLGGRVVVWEGNLDPAGLRGVGEVFLYAHRRGDTVGRPRTMAVSDLDGHFCVRDTGAGDWVLTMWEPLQFRPPVREVGCDGVGSTATGRTWACGVG